MNEGTTPPGQIELTQLQVNIDSTGRPIFVAVPKDITDAELLEVATWMTSPTGMRELLRPPSRIVMLDAKRPRPI